MDIIFIRDYNIKEMAPSIVNHCNRRLLNYLGSSNAWEGCPLFEAELSFNVIYKQMRELHVKILNYIDDAKDTTAIFRECNPQSIMAQDDTTLVVEDLCATELKITAEAQILSVLAAADCIVDHTVKYSTDLSRKSNGQFLGALIQVPSGKKSKDKNRKRALAEAFKLETGKSLEKLIDLIDWRNCRIHEAHFHLTIDRQRRCIQYGTSLNEFIAKSRLKFNSYEFDEGVVALATYLKWWCRKVESFIDQQQLVGE